MLKLISAFFRRKFYRVEYSEIKVRLYIIEMHLGLMLYNEKVLKQSKAKYDITVLNPILEVIHNLKSERIDLLSRLVRFEPRILDTNAVKQSGIEEVLNG